MAKNSEEKNRYPLNVAPTEKAYRMMTDINKTKDIRNSMLARHKQAVSKERLDIEATRYHVDDMVLNRYEVMDYIVVLLSSGDYSLPEICKIDGMPTRIEVKRWERWHPEFAKALQEAKQLRGEALGEKGLSKLIEVSQDENLDTAKVAMAKALYEGTNRSAARLNEEYQDKRVIEHKDVTETMNEEQLTQAYQDLLRRYPELKTIAMETTTIDVDVVEEEG